MRKADKQRMIFKRIRCIAALRGITVGQIAEALDCSTQSYYDYANSRRLLPGECWSIIANILGIDPEHLTSDDYLLDLSVYNLMREEERQYIQ